MKQPTIMYEGNKCAIGYISWFEGGGVCGVSFTDMEGNAHHAFNKVSWEAEGYNENGVLHLDLEKALAHNEWLT